MVYQKINIHRIPTSELRAMLPELHRAAARTCDPASDEAQELETVKSELYRRWKR